MWQTNRGTETSFIRLQQLVKSRYGKGVKILPMMQVLDEHLQRTHFYTGSDMNIPIIVNENYLGTAIIPEAQDLSLEEQSSLAETVKLVLEPSLYTKWLRRREHNLNHVTQLDFVPQENLVLFNDLEKKYLDISHQEQNLNDVRLISNIIHLYGKNDLFVKRVAYQIHEIAHRWAFLPFSDLNDLAEVEDLLNLGAVTLFVDKLENLTEAQQNLILKYLESPRSSQEPLIITASVLTLSELKDKVQRPLIEELTFSCFEVDRAPLSFLELKEILELMFFDQEI